MRSVLIIGGRQDGEWVHVEDHVQHVTFLDVDPSVVRFSTWTEAEPETEPEYVLVGNMVKIRQVARRPTYRPVDGPTFKTTHYPIRRFVMQEPNDGPVIHDCFVAHHPDIDPIDAAYRAGRILSGSASGKVPSRPR